MAVSLPIAEFLALQGPLLDVRSPSEFAQGHIPGSRSLPLLDDAGRAEVGTLYRQQGRQAAVLRGLALVGPRMETLATALVAALETFPPGSGSGRSTLRLSCWRGGMRSGAMAWLAEQLPLPVVTLQGGYKAWRRHALALFERPWPIRLLGGRTGTGKTDLLLALAERGAAVVDLEGLAHHRGSSFGGVGLPPQPSTEHFENRIAAALAAHAGAGEIWLEAESVQVGRCRIPAALWRQMKEAPALEIRRPLERRLAHLVALYGAQDPLELVEATRRIARRLGPQRTALALEALERRDFTAAAAAMLTYYDRCYDHDLGGHAVTSVDLADLDAATAAWRLLEQGLVRVGPAPERLPAPQPST